MSYHFSLDQTIYGKLVIEDDTISYEEARDRVEALVNATDSIENIPGIVMSDDMEVSVRPISDDDEVE